MMKNRIEKNGESPLISIVVPIYRVEAYLRQCVDSILAQTLTDIEVILVDDGSPDNCPAIVDEYAAKDSRVIALHQENGGYGRAVNAGLNRTRGKYIGIIESDDWIEPDMYEKLYNCAEQNAAEVVKCGFYKYDSTKVGEAQNVVPPGCFVIAPEGVFSPKEWLFIFLEHPSLWSNLYRADFLKDIRFVETPGAAYQDGPFIAEVLGRAKRMCVLKEHLVHYRDEPGQDSSSRQVGERCLQILAMLKMGREKLEELGCFSQVQEAWYLFAYYNIVSFLDRIRPDLINEYCQRTQCLLQPLARDKSFKWSFFSTIEKREMEFLISGRNPKAYMKSWKDEFPKFVFHWFEANRECFGIMGKSLISITNAGKEKIYRFMGKKVKTVCLPEPY